MPYSKNPYLPKMRMKTVNLVRSGWSIRKAARHMGVSPGAVSKWLKRAPSDGRMNIPTRSSRPDHSPRAINAGLKALIIEKRKSIRRCSEVVRASLVNDGITVSLSTVKRILRRYGCLKHRSKWAKYRLNIPRPFAEKPGDLVQLDSIHIQKKDRTRIYVLTLLDVVSRWGYAKVLKRISCRSTTVFLREAQVRSPFRFVNLQTDHGPEFGKFFHDWTGYHGFNHRYSRIRRPNDNGHLERFNRTLQDECLRQTRINHYRKEIEKYIEFYNTKRLHLGINLKTPQQVLEVFTRS